MKHDSEQKRQWLWMPAGIILLAVGYVAMAGVLLRQAFPPEKGEVNHIHAVMRRVCDWQLSRNTRPFHKRVYDSITGRTRLHRKDDWLNGVFYAGVFSMYRTTGDPFYLEKVREWGAGNRWLLGPNMRLADDHCVGQTYLDYYFVKPEPQIPVAVRNTLAALLNVPRPGREEWYWSDALFMSPPLWARMFKLTGKQRYLDAMDRMWWDSVAMLYDDEEQLFFRDNRFKIQTDGSGPLEKNGRKIFWSRGNSWVIAGLARILEVMPVDYPSREKYLVLYRSLAEKIASLQQDDGLWRTSLLDPESYPYPESSGSSFFCYALAWGVNHGLLDEKQFSPIVHRAWNGLVKLVASSGRLGWVQKSDVKPGAVKQQDNYNYGAGAFLLAGSEMARLTLFRKPKTR